jgi:hypothetical protein
MIQIDEQSPVLPDKITHQVGRSLKTRFIFVA